MSFFLYRCLAGASGLQSALPLSSATSRVREILQFFTFVETKNLEEQLLSSIYRSTSIKVHIVISS